MKFFDKIFTEEKDLIQQYQQHFEIYKKNFEEFNILRKKMTNLQRQYEVDTSVLMIKRSKLHDTNVAISKVKNIITMIAHPKPMSKEEFDNFNLFNELNNRIKQLKNQIEQGYEVLFNYDKNAPTTYMFLYQNDSTLASYRIFSKSEKAEKEKEINDLEAKLALFTSDQVIFFENKLGWAEDINKRLKRFKQFEEDHISTRESVFSHIELMRETKKELEKTKIAMKTLYETKIRKDRELLGKLYMKLSVKNQRLVEKKQKTVENDDFSM